MRFFKTANELFKQNLQINKFSFENVKDKFYFNNIFFKINSFFKINLKNNNNLKKIKLKKPL